MKEAEKREAEERTFEVGGASNQDRKEVQKS